MRFQRSNAPKQTRQHTCILCAGHGERSNSKGHKYRCKFSDCDCDLCDIGRKQREVARKQRQIHRHQMRQLYAAKSATKASGMKVQFEQQSSGE